MAHHLITGSITLQSLWQTILLEALTHHLVVYLPSSGHLLWLPSVPFCCLPSCQVVSCVLCFWSRNPDLIVMFLTAHLRSNNSPSPVLHYPPVHFPCLIGTASADGVRESYLNGWLWYIYLKSTFFFTNLNGILSTLSMFNAELYIVPPLVRQLILPKSQCLVLCLLSSHIYLPDSRLPGSWLANSL